MAAAANSASRPWWAPAGPLRDLLTARMLEVPGMSARSLARSAGVDKRTVDKLLSGRTRLVSLANAEAILIAAGIPEALTDLDLVV